MNAAGAFNALRLIDDAGSRVNPSGMVLARGEASAMAARLGAWAQHYASLRVTAFQGQLIFWSTADDVRLPWFDERPVYLTHIDKAIFFPVGTRPDLPARWIDPIVIRLAASKNLSRPILLWPSRGRLAAVGLGQNSSPFPAVDWEGFAAP